MDSILSPHKLPIDKRTTPEGNVIDTSTKVLGPCHLTSSLNRSGPFTATSNLNFTFFILLLISHLSWHLAASASAQSAMSAIPEVMIPLYMYPLPGAWDPLFKAAEENPDVHFVVIVNPNNGPGPTPLPDASYSAELERMRAISTIHALGYVHSTYGQRPNDEIKADINTYAAWDSESGGKFRIDGIFIDEAPSDRANCSKMADLAKHIRTAFPSTLHKRLVSSNSPHPQTSPPTSAVEMLSPSILVAYGPKVSSPGFIGLPPVPPRPSQGPWQGQQQARRLWHKLTGQPSHDQSRHHHHYHNGAHDDHTPIYTPSTSPLPSPSPSPIPQAQPSPKTSSLPVVVYNPGVVTDVSYFRDADRVVVFEQSVDEWYNSFVNNSLSKLPSAVRSQAVAMIHSIKPEPAADGASMATSSNSTAVSGNSTTTIVDQISRLGFASLYLTDQEGGGYTRFSSDWNQTVEALHNRARHKAQLTRNGDSAPNGGQYTRRSGQHAGDGNHLWSPPAVVGPAAGGHPNDDGGHVATGGEQGFTDGGE